MDKIILEKFSKKAGPNVPTESLDDLKEKMQNNHCNKYKYVHKNIISFSRN